MSPSSRQSEPDFRELSTRTFRLCLALLRDESDAAEAAQEALMRAWATRSRRRPDVLWSTWTGGFAIRVCREVARSRPISVSPEDQNEPLFLSASASGQRSDLAIRLHGAIAELPDRQREVVTLRWLLGYSTATAAAVLDCPEGTIKSNLHKAVTRLRAVLPAPATPSEE